MKSHLVHRLVHDKGCSGHIARVFHQRDEEVEYKDVGEEYDDATYASYDAVDHHILDRTVRKEALDKHSCLLYQPLDALHGVFAQDEGSLEHDEQ